MRIFILCLLFIGIGYGQRARKIKPISIRLKVVKLEKYNLKLGLNISGEIPKEGWEAKIFRKKFLFLDLNKDGILTDGVDGFAIPGNAFVVYLRSVLLLPGGQFEAQFAVDAKKKIKLKLTKQVLKIPAKVLAASFSLTEFRVRAGLPLILINEEACFHCEMHLDYLKQNPPGVLPESEERAGAPGYSEEGARAGSKSDMYSKLDLATALQCHYRMVWHGVPIFDPTLKEVGVMEKHNRTMLYFYKREDPTERRFHPADGATNIPCEFSQKPENPNPAKGSDGGLGCGYPIIIALPYNEQQQKIISVSVKEERTGKEIEGYSSSPLEPADPRNWPKNSGSIVFVPKKPLKPRTTYQVKFQLSEYSDPIEWSFTTGKFP